METVLQVGKKNLVLPRIGWRRRCRCKRPILSHKTWSDERKLRYLVQHHCWWLLRWTWNQFPRWWKYRWTSHDGWCLRVQRWYGHNRWAEPNAQWRASKGKRICCSSIRIWEVLGAASHGHERLDELQNEWRDFHPCQVLPWHSRHGRIRAWMHLEHPSSRCSIPIRLRLKK